MTRVRPLCGRRYPRNPTRSSRPHWLTSIFSRSQPKPSCGTLRACNIAEGRSAMETERERRLSTVPPATWLFPKQHESPVTVVLWGFPGEVPKGREVRCTPKHRPNSYDVSCLGAPGFVLLPCMVSCWEGVQGNRRNSVFAQHAHVAAWPRMGASWTAKRRQSARQHASGQSYSCWATPELLKTRSFRNPGTAPSVVLLDSGQRLPQTARQPMMTTCPHGARCAQLM